MGTVTFAAQGSSAKVGVGAGPRGSGAGGFCPSTQASTSSTPPTSTPARCRTHRRERGQGAAPRRCAQRTEVRFAPTATAPTTPVRPRRRGVPPPARPAFAGSRPTTSTCTSCTSGTAVRLGGDAGGSRRAGPVGRVALRRSIADFSLAPDEGLRRSERDGLPPLRRPGAGIHSSRQSRGGGIRAGASLSVDQGLEIWSGVPLAGGLLSGPVSPERATAEGSRTPARTGMSRLPRRGALYDIVDVLVDIADGRGVSAAASSRSPTRWRSLPSPRSSSERGQLGARPTASGG